MPHAIPLYQGDRPYLFVSYAHKDRKDVTKIMEAMRSRGYRIWYDAGIKAGADWAEIIGSKIESSAAVLFFLSKHSAKSKHVLRELLYAQKKGIRILTVQLGKAKLSPELKQILAVDQFLVLSRRDTFEDLLDRMEPPLADADVKEAAETSSPAFLDKRIRPHVNRKGGRIVLLILLTLILLLVGYILLFRHVPYVVGDEFSRGKERVEAAGFSTQSGYDYSEEEEYGYIFRQSKNNRAFRFSPILLTQSLGSAKDLTTIPSLIGLPLSDGIKLLMDAGIRKFTVTPVVSEDFPVTFIVAQSIPESMKVSKNNLIKLDVSSDGSAILFEYNGVTYSIEPGRSFQIETSEDGLILSPVYHFGVDIERAERTNLKNDGGIKGDFEFDVKLDRDSADFFGKYRGSLSIGFTVTGENQGFLWDTALAIAGGKNGSIRLQAVADPIVCDLKPYDEKQYRDFVLAATGDEAEIRTFYDPIAMCTGTEIPLAGYNPIFNVLSAITNSTDLFDMSLPLIRDGVMLQDYALIIQRDGNAMLFFYNRNNRQKTTLYSDHFAIDGLDLSQISDFDPVPASD